MCVVSMIGDDWCGRWNRRYPNNPPWDWGDMTPIVKPSQEDYDYKKEIEELKREVTILKEQLQAAKEYDIKNNEPDCEIDEKMEKLRKVANLVGINIDEILRKNNNV